MPLTMSPHDRNMVYVGSQHVHRTSNRGQSWEVISPDLSTNDKTRQQFSGGLTGDNIGVEYAFAVMAIAESRLERGLIWAGTNDGQVQVTRDNGKSWTNVTKNIPNLPPWGTVGNIEPSRYDAGTAYLTVDLHQVNNRDPFVYKTTDYGETWRAITNGIPRSMLSYAHCIREDPVRRGLLYLGTENAIYVSFDDGENWQSLQTNMPHAPVYWIAVQEHFNDLVIATYGRGFWILDDLTPLQQLTPQVLSGDAHLFAPRAAYRFRDITQEASAFNDPTAGQNPPYGAAINYYLRTPPAGDVTVSILDGQNQVVRTLARAEGGGAQSRALGPARRTVHGSPAADQPALRAGHPGRARRHAARRRAAPVDPHAARQLHGPAERRRQAAHAETRGAEGSEFRRHRRRHPRAVQDADRAAARARGRRRSREPDRDRARADRGARPGHGQRRDHEAGARARTEAGRACSRTCSSCARPAAARTACDSARGCSARLAISPTGWPARTSGRPISSSRCRRSCARTYASSRRRWPRLVGKDLKALNELMRGRGIANIVVRPPGSSQQ